MYFVFIYENRRMKPGEIVLRSRGRGKRENKEGGKSKIYITISVSPCITIIC
jgi:hypothetical protein